VNGFFTRARHVKGNAALALRVLQNRVHFAEAYHLTVGPKQRVCGFRIGKGVTGGLQQATGLQLRCLEGVLLNQQAA